MREFQVKIVEKMISVVTVEAEEKEEAYEKALKELEEGFCAPYHVEIDVIEYNINEC